MLLEKRQEKCFTSDAGCERKRETMAAVSERVSQQLEEIFGDRMRTDRVERKMYSFDIGAMPSLVGPFVATGIAGAVLLLQHRFQ